MKTVLSSFAKLFPWHWKYYTRSDWVFVFWLNVLWWGGLAVIVAMF